MHDHAFGQWHHVAMNERGDHEYVRLCTVDGCSEDEGATIPKDIQDGWLELATDTQRLFGLASRFVDVVKHKWGDYFAACGECERAGWELQHEVYRQRYGEKMADAIRQTRADGEAE